MERRLSPEECDRRRRRTRSLNSMSANAKIGDQSTDDYEYFRQLQKVRSRPIGENGFDKEGIFCRLFRRIIGRRSHQTPNFPVPSPPIRRHSALLNVYVDEVPGRLSHSRNGTATLDSHTSAQRVECAEHGETSGHHRRPRSSCSYLAVSEENSGSHPPRLLQRGNRRSNSFCENKSSSYLRLRSPGPEEAGPSSRHYSLLRCQNNKQASEDGLAAQRVSRKNSGHSGRPRCLAGSAPAATSTPKQGTRMLHPGRLQSETDYVAQRPSTSRDGLPRGRANSMGLCADNLRSHDMLERRAQYMDDVRRRVTRWLSSQSSVELEAPPEQRKDLCYSCHARIQRPLPPLPKLSSAASNGEFKNLAEQLTVLSKHAWYWGPISRDEAEDRMKNQPDGSFLVRDSSDDRQLLSLYVRSVGKTLFVRIEYVGGMFSLYSQDATKRHPTVPDLIEYSMKLSQFRAVCYTKPLTQNSLSYPIRLTRPMSRFTEVRSLQYLCRFVIRHCMSKDLVKDLPLPTAIIQYIEEGCF